MLKAIWPSLAHLPNHLSPGANITTAGRFRMSSRRIQSSDSCNPGMMCYFLYWLIQFPFMLISPQSIRWLFLVKAIVAPPTWLAMLIWAFVKVPASSGFFAQHSTLTGTNLSWAWLSALNAALGIYSTLAVNIPDFTVRSVRCSCISSH